MRAGKFAFAAPSHATMRGCCAFWLVVFAAACAANPVATVVAPVASTGPWIELRQADAAEVAVLLQDEFGASAETAVAAGAEVFAVPRAEVCAQRNAVRWRGDASAFERIEQRARQLDLPRQQATDGGIRLVRVYFDTPGQDAEDSAKSIEAAFRGRALDAETRRCVEISMFRCALDPEHGGLWVEGEQCFLAELREWLAH